MYTYDRRFAMEFPTDEALKKYLKDHPDADKSKHSVKKKEEGSSEKPSGSKPSGMTEGMPEELLSNSEASDHPAVKKLKKKLLDDLASGEIKPKDLYSAAIELDADKSAWKGGLAGRGKASNALRAYMEALMESEEPRTLSYSKYSENFFNYKGKELMFEDVMKDYSEDHFR